MWPLMTSLLLQCRSDRAVRRSVTPLLLSTSLSPLRTDRLCGRTWINLATSTSMPLQSQCRALQAVYRGRGSC
jgi:hypothetical protein